MLVEIGYHFPLLVLTLSLARRAHDLNVAVVRDLVLTARPQVIKLGLVLHFYRSIWRHVQQHVVVLLHHRFLRRIQFLLPRDLANCGLDCAKLRLLGRMLDEGLLGVLPEVGTLKVLNVHEVGVIGRHVDFVFKGNLSYELLVSLAFGRLKIILVFNGFIVRLVPGLQICSLPDGLTGVFDNILSDLELLLFGNEQFLAAVISNTALSGLDG